MHASMHASVQIQSLRQSIQAIDCMPRPLSLSADCSIAVHVHAIVNCESANADKGTALHFGVTTSDLLRAANTVPHALCSNDLAKRCLTRSTHSLQKFAI